MPVIIRPGDSAVEGPAKAGIFNRMNWNRLHLASSEALVDADASAVLFGRPATSSAPVFGVGDIGSQSDSVAAISREYEQWVRNVMGWIRRRRTRVWGEAGAETRPDLDIQLNFVNAVYALPGALEALQGGAHGRDAISG